LPPLNFSQHLDIARLYNFYFAACGFDAQRAVFFESARRSRNRFIFQFDFDAFAR
jgi:hypothetical protein